MILTTLFSLCIIPIFIYCYDDPVF